MKLNYKRTLLIGKRMPFILIGTALAVTLLMVLSYADRTQNLIMFVAVLFMLLVSMGLYRSPAVALMSDLTPKPLRSKGNAVINLMGAVGGLFALVMNKLLVAKVERPDYFPMFFAVAGLFNSYHPIMNVFFAIIGFAWASIGVNSLPMVVEMCSAADVGKYTGYYYTFSMSAQVITPILSGFLLEHISYRVLFPYAVVFAILAFVCTTQVKHGDAKPIQKKSLLENFDVDD